MECYMNECTCEDTPVTEVPDDVQQECCNCPSEYCSSPKQNAAVHLGEVSKNDFWLGLT